MATIIDNASGAGKTMNIKIRCYGRYYPSTTGNTNKNFTLHFKATDDNGQSETVSVIVHVELP